MLPGLGVSEMYNFRGLAFKPSDAKDNKSEAGSNSMLGGSSDLVFPSRRRQNARPLRGFS